MRVVRIDFTACGFVFILDPGCSNLPIQAKLKGITISRYCFCIILRSNYTNWKHSICSCATAQQLLTHSNFREVKIAYRHYCSSLYVIMFKCNTSEYRSLGINSPAHIAGSYQMHNSTINLFCLGLRF